MPQLNFGKYKGVEIEEVPTEYLTWAEANFTDPARQIVRDELKARTERLSKPSYGKTIKLSRSEWATQFGMLVDKMPDILLDQTINYKEYSIKIVRRS